MGRLGVFRIGVCTRVSSIEVAKLCIFGEIGEFARGWFAGVEVFRLESVKALRFRRNWEICAGVGPGGVYVFRFESVKALLFGRIGIFARGGGRVAGCRGFRAESVKAFHFLRNSELCARCGSRGVGVAVLRRWKMLRLFWEIARIERVVVAGR